MTIVDTPQQRNKHNDVQGHPGRRMTERQFLDWIEEDTRAEWVNGEVLMMAPVSIEHDKIAWWLRSIIQHYSDHHRLGVVCGPEVLMRLSAHKKQWRLPDVLFVDQSRAAIVKRNHCDGPPDLLIEVVSPDDPARDYREKYLAYQKAQVKEYWIVDPLAKHIEAFRLARTNKYRPIPDDKGKLHSTVLRNFYIRPDWLFGKKPKDVLAVLRELAILH
ncbi:MAG: Uma2 family endonuclease [Planctomycetota bacterium]|nr:Uma2 family endonuclease [Planctomycetota bacterium]